MGEMRVFARSEDGVETDITEGVQALYDIVISSMDWGSGFLTVEEALPVVHVAKTCGFKEYEEAERYVRALQKSEEQQILQRRRREEEMEAEQRALAEHNHVWVDYKCAFPKCPEGPPVYDYKLDVKDSVEVHRYVEWTNGKGHVFRVFINGDLTDELKHAVEAMHR